ncbi:hypothetical protein SpAn4DRAFT_3964 [Sporomusa ovata]|uniref:Uncharacterized protein n=1 Tax=Sporomusa ovata TaxID=2378 RepID=A0A0U1KWF1_9FIRM|nr:hypothetical protein SpAn4DRAFT_3964 [Sporomusa ovata]
MVLLNKKPHPRQTAESEIKLLLLSKTAVILAIKTSFPKIKR